jgi:hypothetical protein
MLIIIKMCWLATKFRSGARIEELCGAARGFSIPADRTPDRASLTL